MNGNNYRFTNQTSAGPTYDLTPNKNCVGIGTTGCTPLAATLQIEKLNTSPLESDPTGILLKQVTDSDPGNPIAKGIDVELIGNNQENYGIKIDVSNARRNFGVYASAMNPTPPAGANYAIYGEASNGAAGSVAVSGNAYSSIGTNQAGFFNASGTAAGGNYGVSGVASGSSGPNVGVYGQAPIAPGNWAGLFTGDVNINGSAFYFGVTPILSDQQFKTGIDSITNGLSIIKQLKPKKYFMDTTNIYGMNFSNKQQLGFLAQDVEQIMPQLVFQSNKGADLDTAGNIIHPSVTYKALNYIEFIPLLTRGIQEQSKTIDSLKTKTTKQDSINAYLQSEINTLTNMINSCCNANNNHAPIENNNGNGNNNDKSKTTFIDVTLQDGQSVVLSQNDPNPYSEQTIIGYFLPDNVGKAQMLFYNAGGKLIQSVELTQRGQGQLNVFAQDLTNGLYTYTLVVDGKIAATKKMVKQ